jgi:glycopeptide antibiotics resistance protein
MVLGAGMELAQLLMHVGRSFDILDLIANIIGTTMGVVAFRLYIKF